MLPCWFCHDAAHMCLSTFLLSLSLFIHFFCLSLLFFPFVCDSLVAILLQEKGCSPVDFLVELCFVLDAVLSVCVPFPVEVLVRICN